MTPKQKKYVRVLLWSHGIAAVSAPVFLLLAYLTRSWGYFRLGECYYRLFFRFYCPGCGGTRAAGALVRLRIGEAFVLSPALFVLIAVILWLDFWILFSILRKRESYLRLASPHLFWGVLAFAVIVSVVRTVLFYTIGYDPLGDLTALQGASPFESLLSGTVF